MDVLTPTGNMPVVEVKPHYIDMEQVKAMAKVLFHGNIAYEPKVGFSKEDLEKEILGSSSILSAMRNLCWNTTWRSGNC